MDTSAIDGYARGEGLQGAVQVSLLKKSQDMEAQQMQQMLQSIKSSSPGHLGANVDVMA